jgi:hypothetical protein
MLNKRQTEIIKILKKLDMNCKSNNPSSNLYYNTFYDLIIREGVFYSKGNWNVEELDLINNVFSKIKKSIKPSCCFYNSQLAVVFDKSNLIKYHEGFYYMEDGFPALHGWNTLNGKLLDFTYEYKLKIDFPENSHIGIEVNKAWVLDCFKTKPQSTSYIDNWEEGYPALKSKHKVDSSLMR